MPRAYIIVEDQNDKFTFQALLKSMGLEKIADVNFVEDGNIAPIEWGIQAAENNPEAPTKLKEGLKSLFGDIAEEKYDMIGIIWDADAPGIDHRVLTINNAFQFAIDEYKQDTGFEVSMEKLDAPNQFEQLIVRGVSVLVGCHIVNLGGNGEIEDILKAIASKTAPIANCVDRLLPECLNENGKETLRQKDLVKLWINHYSRYDTLAKKDRNEANTKWENVMKNRDIFDFGKDSVSELAELKKFLRSFVAQ